MPPRHGLRPLKAWRYVGIYAPELMLCVASVRIGPARQAFWALWDRPANRLHERTVFGRTARSEVRLLPGRAEINGGHVQADLRLAEEAGLECVCPSGSAYGWTRKQGGISAVGTVTIDGSRRRLDAAAIIDDTAAYYERHTCWRWSAGIGVTTDGRAAAWNLVSGVNDPANGSERTVWLDGEPYEPPPSHFADDLSAVDTLSFRAEATRARRENRLLVRSDYRQPFGTFSGRLPGGPELAEGYGVMEYHDAHW
jgi:hypothetical protein